MKLETNCKATKIYMEDKKKNPVMTGKVYTHSPNSVSSKSSKSVWFDCSRHDTGYKHMFFSLDKRKKKLIKENIYLLSSTATCN